MYHKETPTILKGDCLWMVTGRSGFEMVVLKLCPFAWVDPGGPVVIILAPGSEVRRFKPGRGRWIFSERKNPVSDFLQKGSKVVGPML